MYKRNCMRYFYPHTNLESYRQIYFCIRIRRIRFFPQRELDLFIRQSSQKKFYDLLKRMNIHNKDTCYPNLDRPIDCLESVRAEEVVVDVKNEK